MIRVSVVGGSGYVGGELLRLLLGHPDAEVAQVTSERLAGKFVHAVHPNLRKVTLLRFCSADELAPCDVLFLCLPHGESSGRIDDFRRLAPRIVDLSADFRLRDPAAYERWYGKPHPRPDLLGRFVYGIPEVDRAALRDAELVACAGCNATAALLALRPLWAAGLAESAVVDLKVGSSQAGATPTEGSHHPERSGALRSYKPTGHRHTGEIVQELGVVGAGGPVEGAAGGSVEPAAGRPAESAADRPAEPAEVHVSATAVEMVRGVLATCHVFTKEPVDDKRLWRLYRIAYDVEPFVRIVKERRGIHRFPDPKLLAGTNYCDLGFECDPNSNRVVVLAALDNLMKGAAGQAVHAFNVMHGLLEVRGLEFQGLHPA